MLLRELLSHIRGRIECDYEDPANSVGYDSGEGGYQLSTMDSYEVLDEVGLGWDLKNDALRDALAQGMGDCAWVHRSPYSLTEEDARRTGWEEFASLVKHRVRYLLFPPNEHDPNREVTDPSEILDELGEVFTHHDLFWTLKAGTLLFRVRIHSPAERPENTIAALGPPLAVDAKFSNRMSPAGVSMFYAAFEEETAIAETYVRHDGKPVERTTATFRVLEDIVLLDLVDLPEAPSIFDGDEANLERAALVFLHEFVGDLTKPIVKDGREHVEYVPSQVVTEYVRYRLSERVSKPIQGLRYGSARKEDGVGCVLFFAQEDLQERPYGIPKPSFELLSDRTKTATIDTQPALNPLSTSGRPAQDGTR
jgi:hypothetical protein